MAAAGSALNALGHSRGSRSSLHQRRHHGSGAWVASFNRDVMLSSDGFGSGATPWAAV
jgi:hypothetical protein